MTEAEIIEQLVEYANVLLVGLSVFFTIASAYLVGLYAFLGRAGFIIKTAAFLIFTLALLLLSGVLLGSGNAQSGLVEALRELAETQGVSPAGEAFLENAESGHDALIRQYAWIGAGLFYLGFLVLTYLYPWRKAAAST